MRLRVFLKAPSLEDFSHLPPEQRRKRLQQRIDELHKELQKEMDQRSVFICNQPSSSTVLLDGSLITGGEGLRGEGLREGRGFWATSIKQPSSLHRRWFYLLETPWTRWRMCMRRTLRWATPAASSPRYQRPSATWRSCARKSTKTRYEKSRRAGEGEGR